LQKYSPFDLNNSKTALKFTRVAVLNFGATLWHSDKTEHVCTTIILALYSGPKMFLKIAIQYNIRLLGLDRMQAQQYG